MNTQNESSKPQSHSFLSLSVCEYTTTGKLTINIALLTSVMTKTDVKKYMVTFLKIRCYVCLNNIGLLITDVDIPLLTSFF